MTIEEIIKKHGEELIAPRIVVLIKRKDPDYDNVEILAYLYKNDRGEVLMQNEFGMNTVVYPEYDNWEFECISNIKDITYGKYRIEFGIED